MIHVTALAGAIIWLGLNGLLWYTRPSDLLWLLALNFGRNFFRRTAAPPAHADCANCAPRRPRRGHDRERRQKRNVDQCCRKNSELDENRIARRPATQSAVSAANGAPQIGSRPVQFGIAVSRKPAMTAAT